ncbi:MAG: hypothetical protein NVS2B12_17730 [Ktedonobacteraceae bacterium]
MTTASEPGREHQSTCVVQDCSDEEEMNRVCIQDQVLTATMGGVLREQPDADRFQRVLDVACGTGGWMIEAARSYPRMSLCGIDISGRMLDYARAQAAELGVADRIEFTTMDALNTLNFPNDFFDLVNLRLGTGWIRTGDWPGLLRELQRVTRPDGVVRVTEPDIAHEGGSWALTKWFDVLQEALFRAGHLFEPVSSSIVAHLFPLFVYHGVQDVQVQPWRLEYLAGTPEVQSYAADWIYAFRTMHPFIKEQGCLPQNYNTICKQATHEMQQSDFHAVVRLFTVWGQPQSKG